MYGTYLAAARERAGLTPAEAARAVGYDGPDMIYKIEKDKSTPSLPMLDKLAEAYGVLIGDLLPNSGAGSGVMLEPVAAALSGLSGDTLRDEINLLASQARIFRNAVLLSIRTSNGASVPSDNKYRDGNNPRVPSSPSEIVGRAVLGVSEEDEESQGNATGADAGRETDDKRTAKRR